jgi:hypothetical protein
MNVASPAHSSKCRLRAQKTRPKRVVTRLGQTNAPITVILCFPDRATGRNAELRSGQGYAVFD